MTTLIHIFNSGPNVIEVELRHPSILLGGNSKPEKVYAQGSLNCYVHNAQNIIITELPFELEKKENNVTQ